MSDEQPNGEDMQQVVEQANRLANTILLALRTVHEYIAPRALAHGIKLSARETHAWAVSLSIALSQGKAHWRMPATRFEKSIQPSKKAPAKSIQPQRTELFPRTKQPEKTEESAQRFSSPAIRPALRKLREMLQQDSVNEEELLAILKESSPRQTLFVDSLQDIPDRTAELCLERWPTIVELIEAGRTNDGEAA